MTDNDLFDLNGKVAVVTGALGLLGKEHCKALSRAGASIIALDLDIKCIEEFTKNLPTKSIGISTDITNLNSIKDALSISLKHFKNIDILVNKAAINDIFDPTMSQESNKFENYSEYKWKKMFDVNVTGTFFCSQVFGSKMLEQKKGNIINISSTYGVVGPDQNIYKKGDDSQDFFKCPAYPTTKGAVLSFTRYLASYWGSSGIRVNSLSPGGVENNQEDYFLKNYNKRVPLGRMAHKNDYHGALVFLASDASSYMTGANLVVDGGWTSI